MHTKERHSEERQESDTAHGGGTDMHFRLGMTLDSKSHAGKTLFTSDVKMDEDDMLRLNSQYVEGTCFWKPRKGVPR